MSMSKLRPRTRALAKVEESNYHQNVRNPLLQRDVLDLIFPYFEQDPKTLLVCRRVCKLWDASVARWIRKYVTWHIDQKTVFTVVRGNERRRNEKSTDEEKFVELVVKHYNSEIPKIFANFHLSHDNTSVGTDFTINSSMFACDVGPNIVDLRLLASRRSFVDFYLPLCAPQLQRLELYSLSRVPFPDNRTIRDFEFAKVLYVKLQEVILRGQPHSDTVQLCIRLLRNSPRLHSLTLAISTEALRLMLEAATPAEDGSTVLNLSGLRTLKTLYKIPRKRCGARQMMRREELEGRFHVGTPQLEVLGAICPNLTTLALAIADSEDDVKTLMQTVNRHYAKQLLDLELVVWDFQGIDDFIARMNEGRQPLAILDAMQEERRIVQDLHYQIRYLQAVMSRLKQDARPPTHPERLNFGSFPLLRKICLRNWPLKNNLLIFNNMPNLTTVDLQPQISVDPYSYISPAQTHSKVTTVRFNYSEVGSATMTALTSTFPNVTDLDISDPDNTAYPVIFQELPRLKKLRISKCKITLRRNRRRDLDEGLTGIERASLELPVFSDNKNGATALDLRIHRRVPFIGDMKFLEEVAIELAGITQFSIDYGFASMPALRSLRAVMPVDETSTVSVKTLVDKCPGLQRIDIREEFNGTHNRSGQCKILDVKYAMNKRPDLEIIPHDIVTDDDYWNEFEK